MKSDIKTEAHKLINKLAKAKQFAGENPMKSFEEEFLFAIGLILFQPLLF